MPGILSKLTTFEPKWQCVETNSLTTEEIATVLEAKVVQGKFHKCVRIIFNTGEASYIDIEDQDETYKVFDIVDLTKIRIKTLSKPGREDIYRAVFV